MLYICYYGLGEYSRRQSKCHSHGVYNTLYFIIAVIPFWMRFLQVSLHFYFLVCSEVCATFVHDGKVYGDR